MAKSENNKIAVLALTQGGDTLAQKLKVFYPHADVYSRFAGTLKGPFAHAVKNLFPRYDAFVFICALGIVIRSLQGLPKSKKTDPAVVVLDEKGRHAISALSGHLGGANTLAQEIADALGATPVITTASDVQDTWSLDLLGREWGWVLEDHGNLTKLTALMVNQRPIALVQEAGEKLLRFPPNVTVFDSFEALAPERKSFEGFIFITDRIVPWPGSPLSAGKGGEDGKNMIWYRPRTLCLGIGAERGVAAQAVENGVRRYLEQHGLAFASLREIVSLDLKNDEKGMLVFARSHDLPLKFFSAATLRKIAVPNPSESVAREVGTPSVAEAAALAAAGTEKLIAAKEIFVWRNGKPKLTLAVARRQPKPAQGRVTFIGAGPGDPELLTIKARKRIDEADVILYAGSLIPLTLVRTFPPMAKRINTATMDLEAIRNAMLTALREGKHVLRLQSGDLTLYSAVGEQAAILDEQGFSYEFIPGVSAFQAAAAKLQRELTVPEEVQTIILTRAEGNTNMPAREKLRDLAAHQASLCIFLAGRLIGKVQEDLLAAYPPNTPAVVIYRLTWPDEKIFWTTIECIADIVEKNRLVRTTLILVGSALGQKRARSRLYHPTHEHLFRKSKIPSPSGRGPG